MGNSQTFKPRKITLRTTPLEINLSPTSERFLYAKSREEGISDLIYLALNSKDEESWIFFSSPPTWLETGDRHLTDPSKLFVEVSMNPNFISDILAVKRRYEFWHIHPALANGDYDRENPSSDDMRVAGTLARWASQNGSLADFYVVTPTSVVQYNEGGILSRSKY